MEGWIEDLKPTVRWGFINPRRAEVVRGGGYQFYRLAPRSVMEVGVHLGIKDYGKDSLISAGFIDSHAHFPQTPMIAAYGEQLLDWLNKYTFPMELKYSDKEFARSVAKVFLQENLRNGIICGCIYCTVYPQSVDALFEEAEKLGMRLAAGGSP